jgi:hypothetical protein
VGDARFRCAVDTTRRGVGTGGMAGDGGGRRLAGWLVDARCGCSINQES